MPKKKATTSWPAQTEQRRFEHPGVDASLTTAIPRDESHDLAPEYDSMFRRNEQTFRVTKKGNRP